MNIFVIKVISFVVGMLVSMTLSASCTSTMCRGVGKDVLLSVYPNASGSVYLQAGEGKENLDCNLVEGHYMVLKSDHPGFDVAYSTILTALISQKHLVVRIVDGSPHCEVAYVRMYM